MQEAEKVTKEASIAKEDLRVCKELIENGEDIMGKERDLIDELIDLTRYFKNSIVSNVLKMKCTEFSKKIDIVDDVKKEIKCSLERKNTLLEKYKEARKKKREILCKELCINMVDSGSEDNISSEAKLESICVLKELGIVKDLQKFEVHTNIQNFCSFSGCSMIDYVEKAGEQTESGELSHITVYKKIKFEYKVERSSSIVNLAISHEGVLAAYFGDSQNKILIYEIINGLSYNILGVNDTTYIGFYDDNIVLCMNGKEPKYANVYDICEQESLDPLESFESSEVVTGFTNLSDIQVTRKMIYPTQRGIYLYSLDELSGDVIYDVEGCRSIVTASGINVNDIICFYLDKESNLSYLDKEHKSNVLLSHMNGDGGEFEVYSLLPSTTSQNMLDNAVIVTSKGIVQYTSGTSKVEFEKKNKIFSYQKGNSIIRLCNNIFLVSNAENGYLYVCKILVH